jgi:histidinol phosphatase-like PHP family hydrolase
MAFYDLHVHTNLSIGENTVEEIVEMAKRLDFVGVGIARYYSAGRLSKLPESNIDMVSYKAVERGGVKCNGQEDTK